MSEWVSECVSAWVGECEWVSGCEWVVTIEWTRDCSPLVVRQAVVHSGVGS